MAVATQTPSPAATENAGSHVTSEQVWRQIERASFAILGYVTPAGEPRSSGVVYQTVGRRLYTAVAPDSWKARHISAGKQVSVTVPVRRGGILALLFPIPPATISFHAAAVAHPSGSLKLSEISKKLESMVPPAHRDEDVVIELIPQGTFLTYGVGVALPAMMKPELARAVVPVALEVPAAQGTLKRRPLTSDE